MGMFIAEDVTDADRAALSWDWAPETETRLFSSLASLSLSRFDVRRLLSLCIALSNTAPCNSLVSADAWREAGDRGSAGSPCRPQFDPSKPCAEDVPTANGDIICSSPSPSPSSAVDRRGVEEPEDGEKTKPMTRRGVEAPFSIRFSVQPNPGEFFGEHRALVSE